MRFVLVIVALLAFFVSQFETVDAWHCPLVYSQALPEGKGSIPVEFILDGTPRAQVRFSLYGTSAPDVITGPDGRGVFTHIPYGCYWIDAQWRDGNIMRNHGERFFLYPDGVRTWADVHVDRVRLVATSGEFNSSWYNPEALNGPRATVLPDCNVGPWPAGYGDLPVTVKLRGGEPANQVRVSLVDTTHPDQITGEAGPGKVNFRVPYGCYTLRFEYGYRGGLASVLYYPVTVLPRGVHSGSYLVTEISFQITP